MNTRRIVTGTLAWAGLVIVVAVPTIEMVRSKLMPDARALPVTASDASIAPEPAVTKATTAPVRATETTVPVATAESSRPATAPVEPIKTASAATAAAPGDTPAAETHPGGEASTASSNPLDDYLSSGKKLPAYITTSPSAKPAATAPIEQAPATAAPQPTTVASTSPAAPVQPAAVSELPSVGAASATVPAVPPVPMSVKARPKPEPARTVTEADLKDWKSGTLEDYLKQQGLLSSTASSSDGGN